MSSSGVTIVGFSMLALFLAGYLGQKFLPPPKPTAIGIDLGTTYSCATAFQSGTGQIIVFTDLFSNKTCIPSIVAFRKNGEPIVGPEAEPYRLTNPESVIYDAKRFIGKTAEKVDELPFYNRYPYEVNIDTKGRPFFSVPAVDGPIDVKMRIYPEQVSTAIVKRLVDAAASHLNRPVNAVVLAVPADFDEDQRGATKEAAEKAGVKVLRLLNEPTSAAIAYGLHEQKVRHGSKQTSGHNDVVTTLALVLDVGGGTSDVAVLAVRHGTGKHDKSGTSFSTLAIAGSNRLGGQDFTNRLQVVLADKLSEIGRAFAHPRERLRAAAEDAKIELTNQEEVQVRIGPDLVNVTRQEFEMANFDMFQRLPRIITTAIDQASGSWMFDDDEVTQRRLQPSDIDDVVLVGGSTRIPRIRQIIADLFGGRWPHVDVDPELAVAIGAAVQAGTVVGAWPLTVAAVDITPRAANRPKRITVAGEE